MERGSEVRIEFIIFVFLFHKFFPFFRRTKVNRCITKQRQLFEQNPTDQTIEDRCMAYITDKIVPLWNPGWMKARDIHAHYFNTGKPKSKENKKSINEPKAHKTTILTTSTSSVVSAGKEHRQSDEQIATNYAFNSGDKSKSLTSKVESSLKPIKSSNEKPLTIKTEKKHHFTPDILSGVPYVSPYIVPPMTNDKLYSSTSLQSTKKPVSQTNTESNSNSNFLEIKFLLFLLLLFPLS